MIGNSFKFALAFAFLLPFLVIYLLVGIRILERSASPTRWRPYLAFDPRDIAIATLSLDCAALAEAAQRVGSTTAQATTANLIGIIILLILFGFHLAFYWFIARHEAQLRHENLYKDTEYSAQKLEPLRRTVFLYFSFIFLLTNGVTMLRLIQLLRTVG